VPIEFLCKGKLKTIILFKIHDFGVRSSFKVIAVHPTEPIRLTDCELKVIQFLHD